MKVFVLRTKTAKTSPINGFFFVQSYPHDRFALSFGLRYYHPRELFRPAIIKRANQIIILHNHPSGEVDPSEDDIMTTERLKKAGVILGIEILDHIIFTKKESFYSFKKERGW